MPTPICLDNSRIPFAGPNAFRPKKTHQYDAAYENLRQDKAFISFCQSKQLDPQHVELEFELVRGKIQIRVLGSPGNSYSIPFDSAYEYIRQIAGYVLQLNPMPKAPVIPSPVKTSPASEPPASPALSASPLPPLHSELPLVLQTLLQIQQEQAKQAEKQQEAFERFTLHQEVSLAQMQEASEDREERLLAFMDRLQQGQLEALRTSSTQFQDALDHIQTTHQASLDQLRETSTEQTAALQNQGAALEHLTAQFTGSIQTLLHGQETHNAALTALLKEQAATLQKFPQQIEHIQKDLQATFTSALGRLSEQMERQQRGFQEFTAQQRDEFQEFLTLQAEQMQGLQENLEAFQEVLEDLSEKIPDPADNPPFAALLATLEQSNTTLQGALQQVHATQQAQGTLLARLAQSLLDLQNNPAPDLQTRLQAMQAWMQRMLEEQGNRYQETTRLLVAQINRLPQAAPPPPLQKQPVPAPAPVYAAAPPDEADSPSPSPAPRPEALRSLQRQNEELLKGIDDLQKQLTASIQVTLERDRLQEERAALHDRHQSQAAELARLRPALEEARLQIQTLTKRSHSLEARVSRQNALETQLNLLEREVARLKPFEDQITQLHAELSRGNLDKTKLQSLNEGLKGQVQNAQELLQKQKETLQSLSRQLQELQTSHSQLLQQQQSEKLQTDRLQQQLELQTSELTSLRGQSQKYHQQLQEALASTNSLKSDLSSLQREREQLQRQLVELEKEKGRFSSQLDAKNRDIQALQRQVDTATADNRNLRDQLTQLHREKGALESRQSQLQAESQTQCDRIRSLEEQLQTKASQLQQTERENLQQKQKLRELDLNVQRLSSNETTSQQEIQFLRDQMAQQKQLLDRTQQRLLHLQQLEDTLKQKELNLSHLTSQLNTLQPELQRSRESISALESTLQKERSTHLQERQRLLDENHQAALDMQGLIDQLRTVSTENSDLRRLVSRQELQISHLETEQQEALSTAQSLTAEIDSLTQAKRELEIQLQTALARAQNLPPIDRSEIDSLNQKIGTLQSQLSSLESTLREVERVKNEQETRIQVLQEERDALEQMAYYEPNPLLIQHEEEAGQALAREAGLREQIASLERHLDQVARVDEDREALRATIEIQDEQLQSLQDVRATNLQMGEHISHLQQRNQELLGQLQEPRQMDRAQIDRLQQQVREQQSEISALTNTLELFNTQSTQEQQALQARISDLTAQLSRGQEALTHSEQERQVVSQREASLQQRLHQVTQQIASLEHTQAQKETETAQTLERLHREKAELAIDLATASEEAVAFSEEQNRLSQRNAALERTLHTQIESFARLSTEQGLEAKKRIDRLEAEKAELQQKLDSYKSEVQEIFKTLPDLTQKVLFIGQERDTLQRQLQELQQRIAAPTPNGKGNLFEQFEAAQDKIRELKIENTKLSTEKDTLQTYRTQGVKALEQQLQEKTIQLEELRQALAKNEVLLKERKQQIDRLEEEKRQMQLQTGLARLTIHRGSANMAIPLPIAPTVFPVAARIPLPRSRHRRSRSASPVLPSDR